MVLWCDEFASVGDRLTFRERGRVQPRAGGREAETYPAFGGALAHPPELQYIHDPLKGFLDIYPDEYS